MPQPLVKLFPGITWKTDNSPNDALALDEELGGQNETQCGLTVLSCTWQDTVGQKRVQKLLSSFQAGIKGKRETQELSGLMGYN